MTKAFIANISGMDKHYDEIIRGISADILNKLEKKQIVLDRYRSLLGYLLINKFTNDGVLKYNEFGKPYKDGSSFNVSHSGDYVAIVISDFECGIDIEKIASVKPKLKEYTLNEEELSLCYTDIDFYLMWTSKESLAKCIGTGIRRDLKKYSSLPLNGSKIDLEITYSSKSFIYDDYAISVTIKNDSIDLDFNYLELEDIL